MKRTKRIALIAMMGMSLGVNAYSNPNEICEEITNNAVPADVTYCNTLIANSYVKVYQITTASSQLASSVRVTGTSHTTNHVGNFTADILVNHHQDVFVKSTSGAYTQGTIKIESDGRGNYFMSYKTTSSNAGRYYFTIQPLSSEVTIIPLPTGQVPIDTVHEHQTNFGTHESGTGGVLKVVFDGDVGIGTTAPSANLDVRGDIAIKYGSLLKVHTDWNGDGNDKILKTGWSSDRGNYVDLFVPGNKAPSDSKIALLQNGNIGIGTTQPKEKLEINGSLSFSKLYDKGGNFEQGGTKIYQTFSDDSGSAEANIQFFRNKSSRGGGTRSSSEIRFSTTNSTYYADSQQHKLSEKMIIKGDGKVGIGTTTPDMKLTVKGNIHAEEVKIDLNVPAPDYVFKSDYKLRSLEEVESFIKENSHLPEIPSAQEFAKNGVMQAAMDMNLLKKIEELTLYTIQQEKKIKVLEKQNSKIKELEKLVKKLIEEKK